MKLAEPEGFQIPKYLIADALPPHDEGVFIVRTRNPFLVARVEERGMVGLRLHCWPPEARNQTTPNKLAKIVSAMAEIFADEVERMPGLPSQWDFVFDVNASAPRWLIGDNVKSDFTGVIHTGDTAFIAPVETRGRDEAVLCPEEITDDLVREAIEFYREIIMAHAAEEKDDE